MYPEHKCEIHQFVVVPNEYRNKVFMEWLGKELGYKEMDDWYNLTKDVIHQEEWWWHFAEQV